MWSSISQGNPSSSERQSSRRGVHWPPELRLIRLALALLGCGFLTCVYFLICSIPLCSCPLFSSFIIRCISICSVPFCSNLFRVFFSFGLGSAAKSNSVSSISLYSLHFSSILLCSTPFCSVTQKLNSDHSDPAGFDFLIRHPHLRTN